MSLISEFRAFIARGNVIDLAVGVIIGAAFGKIVDSLVKDVIMPPIGYVVGGIDFSDIKIALPTMTEKPAVTINIGLFLNALISFLIIAWCIFLIVKLANMVMARQPATSPAPTTQEKLLMEIRDLLKTRTPS